MATFLEIVGVFDSVELVKRQRAVQGGQFELQVKCCGVPVVFFLETVGCAVCGRSVAKTGRQWMVDKWGARGIKLPPWEKVNEEKVNHVQFDSDGGDVRAAKAAGDINAG